MIVIPPCAIVTAPSDGRVRRLAAPDTPVERGDVVATMDGPGGQAQLRAPAAGLVGGALTMVEQAVTAGEGILWLPRP